MPLEDLGKFGGGGTLEDLGKYQPSESHVPAPKKAIGKKLPTLPYAPPSQPLNVARNEDGSISFSQKPIPTPAQQANIDSLSRGMPISGSSNAPAATPDSPHGLFIPNYEDSGAIQDGLSRGNRVTFVPGGVRNPVHPNSRGVGEYGRQSAYQDLGESKYRDVSQGELFARQIKRHRKDYGDDPSLWPGNLQAGLYDSYDEAWKHRELLGKDAFSWMAETVHPWRESRRPVGEKVREFMLLHTDAAMRGERNRSDILKDFKEKFPGHPEPTQEDINRFENYNHLAAKLHGHIDEKTGEYKKGKFYEPEYDLNPMHVLESASEIPKEDRPLFMQILRNYSERAKAEREKEGLEPSFGLRMGAAALRGVHSFQATPRDLYGEFTGTEEDQKFQGFVKDIENTVRGNQGVEGRNWAETGVLGATEMVPDLMGSYLAGGAGGKAGKAMSTAFWTARTAPDLARGLKDSGFSDSQSNAMAMIFAVPIAAIENMQMDKVKSPIAKRVLESVRMKAPMLAKELAKSYGENMGQEAVQGGLEMMSKLVAQEFDKFANEVQNPNAGGNVDWSREMENFKQEMQAASASLAVLMAPGAAGQVLDNRNKPTPEQLAVMIARGSIASDPAMYGRPTEAGGISGWLADQGPAPPLPKGKLVQKPATSEQVEVKQSVSASQPPSDENVKDKGEVQPVPVPESVPGPVEKAGIPPLEGDPKRLPKKRLGKNSQVQITPNPAPLSLPVVPAPVEQTAPTSQEVHAEAEPEVVKPGYDKVAEVSPTQAEIIRGQAKEAEDLHRNPTGWLIASDGTGAILIHPTENRVVRFPVENQSSGTELLRKRTEALAYAADNPIEAKKPEAPQGELITKPIYGGAPKTYEEAQDEIDRYSDELEKKYGIDAVINAPVFERTGMFADLPEPETPLTKDEVGRLRELYKARDSIDQSEAESVHSEALKKFEPLISDKDEREDFVKKLTKVDNQLGRNLDEVHRKEGAGDAQIGELANEILKHIDSKANQNEYTAFSVDVQKTINGPRLRLTAEPGLGPLPSSVKEAQRWLNHLFGDSAPRYPALDEKAPEPVAQQEQASPLPPQFKPKKGDLVSHTDKKGNVAHGVVGIVSSGTAHVSDGNKSTPVGVSDLRPYEGDSSFNPGDTVESWGKGLDTNAKVVEKLPDGRYELLGGSGRNFTAYPFQMKKVDKPQEQASKEPAEKPEMNPETVNGVAKSGSQEKPLSRGDMVLAYGKYEARVLIPDMGNMAWEPGVARVEFTGKDRPSDNKSGFMEIPSRDLKRISYEETEKGIAEAQAKKNSQEVADRSKKIEDDLVQKAAEVVRKIAKSGQSVNPSTKKARASLESAVSLGSGISNPKIIKSAIDLVAPEFPEPPKKTIGKKKKESIPETKTPEAPQAEVPPTEQAAGGQEKAGLIPAHQAIYDEYLPIIEKQLANESSDGRKVGVIASVVDGKFVPPAVRKALIEKFKELAPQAHQLVVDGKKKVPLDIREYFTGEKTVEKKEWDEKRAEVLNDDKELLRRLQSIENKSNQKGYEPLTDLETKPLADAGLVHAKGKSKGKLTPEGREKLRDLSRAEKKIQDEEDAKELEGIKKEAAEEAIRKQRGDLEQKLYEHDKKHLYDRIIPKGKRGHKTPNNQRDIKARDEDQERNAILKEIESLNRKDGARSAAESKQKRVEDREEARKEIEKGEITRENFKFALVHELPEELRKRVVEMAKNLLETSTAKDTKAALEKIIKDHGADVGAKVEDEKERIINKLNEGEEENPYKPHTRPVPADPVVQVLLSDPERRADQIKKAIASIGGEETDLARAVREEIEGKLNSDEQFDIDNPYKELKASEEEILNRLHEIAETAGVKMEDDDSFNFGSPKAEPVPEVEPVVATKVEKSPVEVGTWDEIKSGNHDMRMAVGKAENHFTLWYQMRRPGSSSYGPWRYISILGGNRDQAIEKAKVAADKIGMGDLTGVSFTGTEQLKKPESIGLATNPLAPEQLIAAEKVPIGEQNVGFGQYSSVQVSKLPELKLDYAKWIVNNATHGRMAVVAGYLSQHPAVVASFDSDRAAVVDAVTPEAVELFKSHGMTVQATETGGILLGGKTYDWKEAIKQFGGRFDGESKAWRLAPEGFNGLRSKLGGLPSPDVGTRGGPGTNSLSPKLAGVRKNADGRLDESGLDGGVERYVSGETKDLIYLGRKIGMPEMVVAEQVEDIALINRGYQEGRKLFVLASEPGSGKTFVLGGAIRELRKSGAKKIVYVTKQVELISQIKEDLKAYGIDGVEFITYSKMRDAVPESSDVLIFDEAHSVKNVEKGDGGAQQAKMAAKWIENSKFTIFASATPFENPVQAEYLEPTGIFDQDFGSFDEFALAYGATKFKVNDETTILQWRRTQTSDADAKAARDYLKKRGVFTSRKIRLPENQVDSRLVKVKVSKEAASMYNALSEAAERNEDRLRGNGSMWIVNFQKRLLEAAKVGHGIKEAEDALKRGRFPIIFVETKAERKVDINDLIRRQDEYERAVAAARKMGDDLPKRKDFGLPPPGVVETLESFMLETGISTIEIPSAEDVIREHFGDDKLAVFTGSVTAAKAQKNLDAWRAGTKPVMVATMAKGGTGLSLHDKVGDHQTTQININLPWTATQVVQVSQRSARYGLKGKAEISWLFSDEIPFDRMLAGRVGGRMADMGAVIHGERMKGSSEIEDWSFDDMTFADVNKAAENAPELTSHKKLGKGETSAYAPPTAKRIGQKPDKVSQKGETSEAVVGRPEVEKPDVVKEIAEKFSVGRMVASAIKALFDGAGLAWNKVRFVKEAASAGMPLFQDAKAFVEFAKNGQAIIRAYKSADASSAIHELAHVARRWLLNRDVRPELRKGISDSDIKTVEEWAGAKDGKWDRKSEEKFARGVERYLRDGEAPNDKLKRVFSIIAGVLKKIYRSLMGSQIDIEIKPEVKEVLDKLFTRVERTKPTHATVNSRVNLEARKESDEEPGVGAADVIKTWGRLFGVVTRLGQSHKFEGPKGGRVQGFYNWLTEVIRVRDEKINNIAVAAHEIAHHIDNVTKTTNSLGDKLVDAPKDANIELQTFDYDPMQARVHEGWAEFIRNYLSENNLEALKARAPVFFKWFESDWAAKHPKEYAALKEAREYGQKHLDQSIFARAAAAIGRGGEDLDTWAATREGLHSFVAKTKLDWDDDVDPFVRAQAIAEAKAVEQNKRDNEERRRLGLKPEAPKTIGIKSDKVTPEEAIRFTRMLSRDMAERAINTGVTSVVNNGESLGPALVPDENFNSVLETEWQVYCRMKRGLFLRETMPDYEFGATEEEAQKFIDYVEADPKKLDRFEKRRKKLVAFYWACNKMMVQAGAMTQEKYDAMREAHGDDYLNMSHLFDEADNKAGKRSLFNIKDPAMRLSKAGSSANFVNLWDHAVNYAVEAHDAAVKAWTQQQILKFFVPQYGGHKGMGWFMEVADPDVNYIKGKIREVAAKLVEAKIMSRKDARAAEIAYQLKNDPSGLGSEDYAWFAKRHGLSEEADIRELLVAAEREPDFGIDFYLRRIDFTPDDSKAKSIWNDPRGNPITVVMDRMAHDALNGDQEFAGLFSRALTVAGKLFKLGTIESATDFVLSNILHDTGDSPSLHKHTKGIFDSLSRVPGAAVRVLGHVIKLATGKLTKENANELISLIEKYGGKLKTELGPTAFSKSVFRHKKMGRTVHEGTRILQRTTESASNAISTFTQWMSYSDAVNRLPEAEAMLEKLGYKMVGGKIHKDGHPATPTMSEIVRIMGAYSDANTDFTRSGRKMRRLNRVVPLINPMWQANAKFFRQFGAMMNWVKAASKGDMSNATEAEKILHKWGARLLSISALQIASGVLYGYFKSDDEEYLEGLNQYEKDGKILIDIPGIGKRPIPFGRGLPTALFHLAAEISVEAFRKDKKEKQSYSDLVKQFWVRDFSQRFIPTWPGLPSAAYQVAHNKDYAGRDIEKREDREDNKPSPLRTNDKSTVMDEYLSWGLYKSDFLRQIGADLSPAQINHLINGLTGNLYQRTAEFGGKTIGSAKALFGGGDPTKGWSAGDAPFVGRILYERKSKDSVNSFYKTLQNIKNEIAIRESEGKDIGNLNSRLEEFQDAKRLLAIIRATDAKDESGRREYKYDKYLCGIARDVMGLGELQGNPNPFKASDLPEEIKKPLQEFANDAVLAVKKDYGKPHGPHNGKTLEETMKQWRDERAAKAAWLERNKDSVFVKNALRDIEDKEIGKFLDKQKKKMGKLLR